VALAVLPAFLLTLVTLPLLLALPSVSSLLLLLSLPCKSLDFDLLASNTIQHNWISEHTLGYAIQGINNLLSHGDSTGAAFGGQQS
jgi:hypothetical protein